GVVGVPESTRLLLRVNPGGIAGRAPVEASTTSPPPGPEGLEMNTFPSASAATPPGRNPATAVRVAMLSVKTEISSTCLFLMSVKNRSPPASTETAAGVTLSPDDTTVVCGPPPPGTSTSWLLPVSATNTSPFLSTATPCGASSPLPTVVCAPPPDGTSTTWLFPVSAMNTSPLLSTATPCGASSPLPTVVCAPPPAGTSTTRLLPVSAINRSPFLSTANPAGSLSPPSTAL